MIKVAIIYKKDKYITREYTDQEDLSVEDNSRTYGNYDFLEDAIDSLAETYPNGEEFVCKLIGFQGVSK